MRIRNKKKISLSRLLLVTLLLLPLTFCADFLYYQNRLYPGRDATIAFGATDLKIHNNRDHHIWVSAHVEEGQLVIHIFGRPLKERVEITTKTLHTYEPPVKYEADHNLASGEEEVDEGYPGYLVEVWQTVYLEDEIISQKKISVDHYNPHPTIIRQGVNAEKSS